MENASKALLMAGGILIGMLVLSLGIYLYTSFGQTYNEMQQRNVDQEVIKFNMQFISYADKKDLTIYDVIKVVGFAKENNKYYDSNSSNIVQVFLNNERLDTQESFDEKIKKDIQNMTIDKENNKVLPTYSCYENKIEYNGKNGRISKIVFTKN